MTAPAATKHKPAKAVHKAVPLDVEVRQILGDPAVARAHWGISVVTPEGKPVYALNDGQFFEPASNAKLFTTAAALALLPANARWTTTVVTSGAIDANGTLTGDVRLLGWFRLCGLERGWLRGDRDYLLLAGYVLNETFAGFCRRGVKLDGGGAEGEVAQDAREFAAALGAGLEVAGDDR